MRKTAHSSGTTARPSWSSSKLAVYVVPLLLCSVVPFATAQVPELRACWLTQYTYVGKSEAQLRAMAANMRAGGMNTVYLAMYSGATTYWPSKAYKAAGGQWASSSIDYAAYLTDIFKSEGLAVGAWFEYGMAVGLATHPLAVANPTWLARDAGGDPMTGENGGFVFLSPGNADAMNMLTAMVLELAENYNFDDIQVDRYRWGRKTTGREYGYEASTVALYNAQYGNNPPSNVNNATWVAFRENLVNEAMQQAYDAIKAANPEIVVSSAPVGSYGITQHMQRWSAWVNGGYMDLVMPQMYMTTLGSFQTEFNTQRTQAGVHVNKLGVGYRANEDNDWQLTRDQLNYARAQGVPHGTLWVYHQYTAQIAIQDQINNLPDPGQPWNVDATNPFVSDRMVQLVTDNRDGATRYAETGSWTTSAQADFFRFDSRVIAGGTNATANWAMAIPKSGRYDAYAWYTASGNRNDAAAYTVMHANGSSVVHVDQRTDGGQWVLLGRFVFNQSPSNLRVSLSTAGSTAAEFTSADAVKLVLAGFAGGDANGDGVVDFSDFQTFPVCMTGPDFGGPIAQPCEAFEFNDDLRIDMIDLASMQAAATP